MQTQDFLQDGPYNGVCVCVLIAGWYLRQKPVGGGGKAGGLPHLSLSPFHPSPFPFPPTFSDKPVGGKVRSSEGEVPRLPPYKYHRDYVYNITSM